MQVIFLVSFSSSSTTSAISSKGSTNGYSNGYKLEDNPMKVTLTEIDFTLNTQVCSRHDLIDINYENNVE